MEQKTSTEKPPCSSRSVPHLSPITQPFPMVVSSVCISNGIVGSDRTGLANSCNISFFPDWNHFMNYKQYIDAVISFIFHFWERKKIFAETARNVAAFYMAWWALGSDCPACLISDSAAELQAALTKWPASYASKSRLHHLSDLTLFTS